MSDLKQFYDGVVMLTPGEEMTYRDYTLRKVEVSGVSPPDHSEVGIYNPDGKKVESFTVGAFDSYKEFRNRLDEIIEYDPDDMEDWLNRDK